MKKIALILAVCLLLTVFAACTGAKDPGQPDNQPPASQDGTGNNTPDTPEDTGNDTPETPDNTGSENPDNTTDETPVTGPQPAQLAGTWQRTHTEVEGDRNKNTKATITITGDTADSLVITYKDKEFPDDNFKDKKLTVKEGELYYDCENGSWYAEVASTGKYGYCLTLLPDGSLLLQCSFEFDGYPMVGYQWFAKSE